MKNITRTLLLTLTLTSGNLLHPPLEAGKNKKSLKIKHRGKKLSLVDALFLGAKEGDIILVTQALEQGVDINARNDQGCTALNWAMFHGMIDVVQLLLTKPEVDINAQNDHGCTALYWAVFHGNIDVVQCLLNDNAKTNIKARSGVKLNTFLHNKPVRFAVFSPNGNNVLTASEGHTAILWDLIGNKLTTFQYKKSVRFVTFSPDGNRILTASNDKNVVLYDLLGNILATFIHTNFVYSAVFSPDGTKVLTASKDNTAVLWDLEGTKLKTFPHHKMHVNSAVFSPNGNKVLTASSDKTVVLWDLEGNKLKTFLHKMQVKSAVFSPDENKLLTASRKGAWNRSAETTLWDLQGNILKTFLKMFFNYATFSPDGTKILSTQIGNPEIGEAVVWDLEGNKLKTFTCITYAEGQSPVFSPDSTQVLIARTILTDNDLQPSRGEAVLWGSQDDKCANFNHERRVNTAKFSPDGTRVLTASIDNTAVLWDTGGTLIDLAVRQATAGGDTDVLMMLLNTCDTLQGHCSDTLLHGLCHAAAKVKDHMPEHYQHICTIVHLLVEKPGAPLHALYANEKSAIDWAIHYGLDEIREMLDSAFYEKKKQNSKPADKEKGHPRKKKKHHVKTTQHKKRPEKKRRSKHTIVGEYTGDAHLEQRHAHKDSTSSNFVWKKLFLLAAKTDELEDLKECLANNIDLSLTDRDGLNALHIACLHAHKKIISTLLEHGVDVNAVVTHEGPHAKWTPLHCACMNNDTTIVKLLLNRGAQPHALNNKLQEPLDIAQQHNHEDVFNMLIAQHSEHATKDPDEAT